VYFFSWGKAGKKSDTGRGQVGARPRKKVTRRKGRKYPSLTGERFQQNAGHSPRPTERKETKHGSHALTREGVWSDTTGRLGGRGKKKKERGVKRVRHRSGTTMRLTGGNTGALKTACEGARRKSQNPYGQEGS